MQRLSFLAVVCAHATLSACGGAQTDDAAESIDAIAGSGSNRLYTTSISERDQAITSLDFKPEGVAAYVYSAPTAGSSPLHRLHAPNGRWLYTASDAERDAAVAQLGFVYEGIAAHVFTSQVPNSVALYRLRKGGEYLYTISNEERDAAVSVHGYTLEGVACFVFAAPAADTVPFYRLNQIFNAQPTGTGASIS